MICTSFSVRYSNGAIAVRTLHVIIVSDFKPGSHLYLALEYNIMMLLHCRNVLVESARIARGKIAPLDNLQATGFDALVFPGGFGAAKNLYDKITQILIILVLKL